jgi:hypothetical protein
VEVAELEADVLGEEALGDGEAELAAADDEGAAEPPPPKQPESPSRRASPRETGMVREAPRGALFDERPRGHAFMRQG